MSSPPGYSKFLIILCKLEKAASRLDLLLHQRRASLCDSFSPITDYLSLYFNLLNNNILTLLFNNKNIRLFTNMFRSEYGEQYLNSLYCQTTADRMRFKIIFIAYMSH